MLGACFGSFRSRDRHFFGEAQETYKQLAKILAVRTSDLALPRGRQYMWPISEEGISFWYPNKIGEGRMTSMVAWSRIMSNRRACMRLETNFSTPIQQTRPKLGRRCRPERLGDLRHCPGRRLRDPHALKTQRTIANQGPEKGRTKVSGQCGHGRPAAGALHL
ncbi:hypothetical protein GCM10009712_03120 [Pseudarthrobacter sulfonivorans]